MRRDAGVHTATGFPPLPAPRGPITRWLFRRLRGRPTVAERPPVSDDPRTGEDLHLALHCTYELTYRGFGDVAPGAERDPLVRELQADLEDALLADLRAEVEAEGGIELGRRARVEGAGQVVDELLASFEGPSLSGFLDTRATVAEFREFMVHRSAYQLKEADPHTMGLARLVPGPRKAAYATMQFDEYGNGEPGSSHAELFAVALEAAGLDARYGAHLDALPAETLATGNLLGLFAGRPDLLPALVGHLAVFEMTSVGPMARCAAAVDRLGLGPVVRRFYDVHVVADEEHGRLARSRLLGDADAGHDDLDPAEIVFGAHALLLVEDRFARRLLDAWATGGSSLRSVPRRASRVAASFSPRRRKPRAYGSGLEGNG